MTQGKARVGVYGVCVRDGKILLVHQLFADDPGGLWTLPGGGLLYGESPADGVRREIREEVGCSATIGDIMGVHDNTYVPRDGVERHGVRLLFDAHIEGEPVVPSDDAIDQVGWFNAEGLPESITEWAVLGVELATRHTTKTSLTEGV